MLRLVGAEKAKSGSHKQAHAVTTVGPKLGNVNLGSW